MSESIRSVGKRASKEFRKNSIDVASSSNSLLLGLCSSIQREENNDLSIIYSIREELIKIVLDKCMEKDFQKSLIKYTVNCAYEAIKRIIELEFNMHDFGKEDFSNNPVWIPDKPPICSPPDTWAASNVPIVSTIEEEEPPQRLPTLVSVQKPFNESLGSSKNQSERSEEISPPQSLTSFVEQYLVAPNTSEVEMEECEDDYETDYYVKKEKSVFTTLLTCPTESNPFSQQSNLKWSERQPSAKLQKSKSMKGTSEKRISRAQTESKISMTSLPPLRAEAQLKIMGSFSKDEAKKDSQKKTNK